VKGSRKIIVLTGIAILSFWIIDATVDTLFHYDESFAEVLTDKKEVAFRSLASLCFLIFGFILSRTFRKQIISEKELRESEEKYRALVESTQDSIYLVDRNYKYIFMNRKHMDRMGFIGNGYKDQEYSKYHTPDETEEFVQGIQKVFDKGISLRKEHYSERDKRSFLRTFSPVIGEDESIIAVTVVSKDITELKLMEDRLQSLAITDDLTGIYNRRGFFTLINQQMKMALRRKKGLFIVYADVDNLKGINDSFGHYDGDRALVDAANVLKETYRDSDVIARIGGDEFVVVPMETTEDKFEHITARLQENVAQFNSSGQRRYKLSMSIGVAYFDPESPASIDELLHEADKLMYTCKRKKRKAVNE
jgi:diguanylate cyclase (GGDEF)-like protein/PAS domain S-box-containing protein